MFSATDEQVHPLVNCAPEFSRVRTGGKLDLFFQFLTDVFVKPPTRGRAIPINQARGQHAAQLWIGKERRIELIASTVDNLKSRLPTDISGQHPIQDLADSGGEI